MTRQIRDYGTTFAAWLMPVAYFVLSARFLIGFDAYYHVQLSKFMVSDGIFLQKFPWATETIWVEAWFDKEWFFHLLLLPFVAALDTVGAQILLLLLVGACCFSIIYFLRGLEMSSRAIRFWIALLPFFCWGIFWVRLVTCRPHLLSLVFLFLCLGAMVRRRHILLGIFTGLYALSYTGHWQILGLVAIYDVVHACFDERGNWRRPVWRRVPMVAACFAGMLIGNLIHPNFPANVRGLYVQNILVLFEAWTSDVPPIPMRPQELRPAGKAIFWLCGPIWICLALGVYRCIWIKPRRSPMLYVLIIFTAGYALMAYKSFRFLEYFVPISITLIAWFFYLNPIPKMFRQQPKRLTVLAVSVIALTVFGAHGYLYYFNRYVIKRTSLDQNTHRYASTGEWLRRNMAPDELLFSTSWSDNAILWYHAPQVRHLFFLDPIFMKKYDDEAFALYLQILSGQHRDPADAILTEFNARVVYVKPKDQALINQLQAAGYTAAHIGARGERLYVLREKAAPAATEE